MDFLSRLFQGKQLQRSREVLELFRAPRYTTTERNDLKNLQEGMIIWNTTTDSANVYNGTDWEDFLSWDKDAGNWDDLRFPVQGINPTGAASPPSVDTADGCLVFSASATNVIAGVAQMPHAWEVGTAVRPHIHWQPSNTHTGNVYWRFEYEIQNVNDTFTGSLTTQNTLDPGDGTALKHQIHNLMEGGADLSMTGFRESCIMKWKISRIGNDGTDDFTGTAKLLEFDIHYKTNKLGTVDEYPTP